MSTLNKVLLGIALVALICLGVAIAKPAQKASAECIITQTLKLGSKNADVACLQISLGGLVADGSFGPLTKVAVQAFQASHGLVADGVFGPKSLAALTSIPVGNFPAGCTTAVGFSPTTGVKCDGSTTVVPTNTVLTGGAADVSITSTGTDVENSVNEGSSEKVLGFKVEAAGGDVAVTSVRVTLENTDTVSSPRLSRYASKVQVLQGSTVVGSADVSEFSKDNDVYTKSIALSGAVVKEGSSNKSTFFVKVTAVNSIDSTDVDNNSFEATVNGARFQDSTGVIMTSSDSVSKTFSFGDLASSGDVKLTISKGSDNPVAGNVEVSNGVATSDVTLLTFKIKATGSDITFDQLTFAFDGTVAGANDLSTLINDLVLKNGSSTVSSSPDLSSADDQNVTFDLDDTFTVSAGSTETFSVVAKVNKINDHFTSGDDVKVSLSTSGIDAEDENGDSVTNESGSANGEVQTFISNGAAVSYVGESFTAENITDSVDGTISLKFKVNAFGDNDVVFAEDQFPVDDVLYTLTGGTVTDAIVTSSDIDSIGGDFTVSSGDSKTFTLSVKFNTTAGFVRLALNSVAGTGVVNVKTAAH